LASRFDRLLTVWCLRGGKGKATKTPSHEETRRIFWLTKKSFVRLRALVPLWRKSLSHEATKEHEAYFGLQKKALCVLEP
jgi:hypothetical protein